MRPWTRRTSRSAWEPDREAFDPRPGRPGKDRPRPGRLQRAPRQRGARCGRDPDHRLGSREPRHGPVVRVGRMHSHFRRWYSEDQPSFADVDVRESQHVAQEGAVSIRIRAVDD